MAHEPASISARPYVDADLPRLQAALAHWRHAAGPCGYCHIGDLAHRIYATPSGRHTPGELVQVWEQGPRVVGVAINLRFEAAFDVFTSPDHRGGVVELAMLRAAAATTLRLARDLGSQPELITDVYGCDEARKALLGRLGFAEYRQWDDVRERSLAEPLPQPQLPAGFAIRPAVPGDYAGLAAARNSAFDAGWTPERYRDAVMRSPGYRPEHELVAIAPDGRIAAFAVLWLDALNRVGLFEPVGAHGDFRRLGLARALMLAAMGQMRAHGMATALVAHDAANLPARRLYEGLGFQTCEITLGYRLG